MVQSRLSSSGGARSVIGALAAVKANQKASGQLARLSILTTSSELTRALLERLCAQDAHWSDMVCQGLSSGAFSELGTTYSGIGQAIDVLGLPTVVLALRATSLHLFFKELERASPFKAALLSRQAVVTAVAAGQLAVSKGLEPSLVSGAGLLHNLGLAVAAFNFPADYCLLRDQLPGSGLTLADAESDLFGFNHLDVARTLIAAYGFSAHVLSAATEHHGAIEDKQPIVQCVMVGSMIAHQLGAAEGLGTPGLEIGPDRLRAIGFDDRVLEGAVIEATAAISNHARCPLE